jgi:hypothetical protein
MNIEYKNELNQFKLKFKNYTKNFLRSIQSERKKICSFGVFADQDMSSFLLCYNTKEHLIEYEVLLTTNDKISTNPAEDIWWIPEWEGSDEDLREPINEELHTMMNKFYKKMDFVKYKDTMFNLFCEALKELREEGVFLKAEDDFLLLVQESDNFSDDDDKYDLKLILSDKQWQSYVKFNSNWQN